MVISDDKVDKYYFNKLIIIPLFYFYAKTEAERRR